MRERLIKVSVEEAGSLTRWEGSVLPPYSEARRRGPRYYTAVPDDDEWDIITYYID
jgi:hypothetical protein